MIFILDNIRSASNIGSIFRTADCLGVSSILICGISATPPHKEILKTALGATEDISWTYYPSIADALAFCRQNQIIILGLEQSEQSIPLNQYVFENNKTYAIVLGNEVEGVASNVLQECDATIEIPQFGNKKSFNVSVAAGITAWEIRRHRLTD